MNRIYTLSREIQIYRSPGWKRGSCSQVPMLEIEGVLDEDPMELTD